MHCRVGDLEFRHLETSRAEIVSWQSEESCYSLLCWRLSVEGYQIEFIGSRPFDYHASDELWAMMRYGQEVLDATFKLKGFYDER